MLALNTLGANINTQKRSQRNVPRIVLATRTTTLYRK